MDEDYADEESVPSEDYDEFLRREEASNAAMASSSRAPPSDARGRLVVHLRDARGLRAADRGGTSDPYATLKLGPDGAAQKSRVIKGTLAPTWDERFEFRGTLGGARGAQLILAVYDHDGLSFNDSLGEARLSLASLNRIEFAAEHTLLLEGKKATGEVTIGVEWVDEAAAEEAAAAAERAAAAEKAAAAERAAAEAAAAEAAAAERAAAAKAKAKVPRPAAAHRAPPASPGASSSDAAARGTLVVHLRDASGLRAADRGGTSDPYVKLKLGGAKRQSAVRKKTLTPSWDESYEFAGTLGALAAETLAITVYDYDGLSFNDTLGEARVPLAALLRRGCAEELTLPLDGKKATGHVRIALSWVDEGAPSAGTRPQAAPPAAAPTSSPAGTLVVHLRSARGLRAADRGGTSDPYVKLKLGGTERKSKVIKGTVAPVRDETFEFRGTLGGVRGSHLTLAVYDHDGLSFNDTLGEARLSLASFGRTAAEHTLQLEGKKATGEVTIGLSWVADPPTAAETAVAERAAAAEAAVARAEDERLRLKARESLDAALDALGDDDGLDELRAACLVDSSPRRTKRGGAVVLFPHVPSPSRSDVPMERQLRALPPLLKLQSQPHRPATASPRVGGARDSPRARVGCAARAAR